MAGLFCKGEIPVLDQQNATEKNKIAWENYYENVPELRPILANKVYEIRVKRIIDSRLEDFSDERYDKLFRQLEDDLNYYLGYDVKIRDVGKEDILHFFRRHTELFNQPQFQYYIGKHYLQIKKEDDKLRLKNTIRDAVQAKPWNIVKQYIADPSIKAGDVDAITEYFYTRFLDKYNRIGEIPLLRSTGNLREGKYELTQNYLYWSSILYESREADLYITNSLIASVDDTMPLYVINRGGITSGFTENNLHNSYQGAIVLTLLPFISNAKYFNQERGNLYENLLTPIISMMGVHEFGHLLKRFDEYYDLPGTPQNAPVDLHYQKWYQDIVNATRVGRRLRILKKY